MTLPGISVRRPVLAAVSSVLVVVVGVLAFRGLPLRELPDVDAPIVSVDTAYPGANAEVVENRITQVIEDQLSGIQGVETITSSSRDGRSSINLTFRLSRDLEAATNDVRDAVNRVAERLPEEARAPEVAKQDPDARPIIWYGLQSDTRDIAELSDFARRIVVDRLSTIDGVARVSVGGSQDYSMRISIDRRALAARGLTITEIETALRRQNVELPAGEIETGAVDLRVRVARGYQKAEEFARLPIATGEDGHIVRLAEVADVEIGPAERRSLFRGNGVNRVGIGIVRQSQANEIEVAERVAAEVARINDVLPDDMSIELTFDGTVFVKESVREVWFTLGFAVALVVLVMYLFLGSVRAALVPTLAVPVSIVGVFAVLALFGFSINILTLLAIVLAIGLVVDDAIVVLENVQRRVDLGEPRLIAADRGSNQVFFAVIATTAVIVAVFAPLAFLGGYVGRIFVELAVTISGAVIISSFVALTLTPMLCSKLLVPANAKTFPAKQVDQAVDAVRRAYRGALELLLPHAWAIVLVLIGAGAGAWVMLRAIPFELVPQEDRGSFFMSFQASEGASFEHTADQAAKLEEIVLSYIESGEAQAALVRVPGFGGTGFNSGVSIVVLKHWDERERNGLEILGEVNRKLGELTGLRAFAGMRSPLGGGGGDDIQFVIQGQDYAALSAAADDLITVARANPNLQRLRKSYEPTSPRTIVDIDRERAAALGVTVEAIGRTLESQLGGRRIGTYVDGGEEYDIILQNKLEDRSNPSDLSNLFVRSQSSGQLIPLTNLVTITERGEAGSLPRVNRLRSVTVTGTLAPGYALGDAIEWFRTDGAASLPPDTTYEFIGSAKDFQDANNAVLFAFAMALLIVFLVLAGQFESLIHPFVIMLTVPLAVAGGLFGLLAVGSTLNMYSQIGLIILVGLAAKNGILIVEFANQLREEGRSIREAVLEASETRLRPILMTGLSTAVGALPLVLADGAGAESRLTIGVVIFAGVMVATLFTLIVVPVFYALLARYTKTPGWVAREIDKYNAIHPADARPAE